MTDEQTDPRTDPEWVFLIDPAWQPAEEGDRPPAEAVVGGWFVDAAGEVGRFHANPDYEPSTETSPTDPVDATLQLVTQGKAGSDELMSTLREAVVGVAVDEDDNPVVDASPDGVPCVLVTTAPAHRDRIEVQRWAEVHAVELAAALPDEGIDVLLNPGAPASMRLIASAVKEAFEGMPIPEPEPDFAAPPEDPIGMLCESISYVGELSDEMMGHAADDLIDRVSYPATVEEFYPALREVVTAGAVPGEALARVGDHDEPEVLDFLSRLTTELERRQPWPTPALVMVDGRDWPSPGASVPIAQLDVPRDELETAVHARFTATGDVPFMVLRLRSGQVVGLAGDGGAEQSRFTLLLPDLPDGMGSADVITYLARYTGLEPVALGAGQ
ncbi:type VII secretion system-associated protein [Nocardia aurantia]|uniref:Uncharacterized protein n=1 Tax=Nocardia aurantia TaxID=2585199 RepID=A0A7K0DGL6_9NOCA|nr:type VII secretion system-associated protein [Nocardia aurantia]MQY24956.1 hypothetical protein [Nocardia aurantia]